jgi:hypothetical protein
VLVAVGAGDEALGAGAGVVAGGARVWLTAGLGAGADDGLAAAVVACTVRWLLGRVAARGPGRVLARPCGFAEACPAAGAGVVAAGDPGGTVCTFAAGAGAVRANTIANPTVASVPS